jgi:hypothetical protein
MPCGCALLLALPVVLAGLCDSGLCDSTDPNGEWRLLVVAGGGGGDDQQQQRLQQLAVCALQ